MIRIGDTPESLGSVTTANALVIDGKVFTKEQVIVLQAERDEQAQRIRELERDNGRLQVCGDAACVRLKEVIADRDALAAQAEALIEHLTNFGKTETLEDAVKWEDDISKLIDATPQHHLADHDAEVAEKTAKHIIDKCQLIVSKVPAVNFMDAKSFQCEAVKKLQRYRGEFDLP